MKDMENAFPGSKLLTPSSVSVNASLLENVDDTLKILRGKYPVYQINKGNALAVYLLFKDDLKLVNVAAEPKETDYIIFILRERNPSVTAK